MNGTHQLLVYANDDNLLTKKNIYICTVEEKTGALLVVSNKIGLEVNSEKMGMYSGVVNSMKERITT